MSLDTRLRKMKKEEVVQIATAAVETLQAVMDTLKAYDLNGLLTAIEFDEVEEFMVKKGYSKNEHEAPRA